jgi:hypothetical protein
MLYRLAMGTAKIHPVLALLVLVAASCGPSAAQLKKAREAEYPMSAAADVYAAAREAMLAQGYEIAGEDPQRGIIVSTWRWYTKEGMAKKTGNAVIEDGAASFRIGVELGRGPRGGIIVHVDGGAQGYTTGSPVAQRFEHGDPREPWWVQGKIDSLTLAIYDRLQGREMAAGPPASR